VVQFVWVLHTSTSRRALALTPHYEQHLRQSHLLKHLAKSHGPSAGPCKTHRFDLPFRHAQPQGSASV